MVELKHLTNPARLPLSNNQKRLWIVYQQDKYNPAYNIPVTYHLEGEVNIDTFKRSLNLLFERQHTLFSVFKQKRGEPYIEIAPGQVILELIDFSGLTVNLRKESILSFAGKDTRKWIDIEEGPLYRLHLLKENNASYYFHATFQHLIFDAWSLSIFVRELSSIYSSLSNGEDGKLDPLLYHSYDFTALEEISEEDKDEKTLVEFWKENLKDCTVELQFPYDYPRKDTSTGLGYRESLILSASTTSRLKEICAKSDSSLFKTLIAVLGVLLQKYTGENDICIGFPVSTRRTHSYLEKLFGFFINTTVARLIIDDDTSFSELINYAKNVAKNAMDNSKLPFDKVVAATNPERRSNVNPVFQVALSWVSNTFLPMDLNGIRGERVNIPEGVSPGDITFYLWEEGAHIKGDIEYNTDLLKPDTIIRLKNNFIQLVENLIQNPDVPLHSISVTTEEELNQILGFTSSQNDYPKDKTIADLFKEMVTLYPEKTAVVFKKESLTYSQLNSKTNQLARTLRAAGVGKNTPVGILAEKSLDIIIGILGILKSGGAYVPVDSGYPLERINFIINDSGCKVLVVQDKFMNLPVDNVIKLNLNSSDTFHKDQSDVEKINAASDLAYILYTSGTTGTPKGTQILQQGVVRLVRNTNYIDLTPNDSMLMAAAIVFDASTLEIWGALLNGGSLYVIDKETLLSTKDLGEVLISNEITIGVFTSSLFTQIAEINTSIFHKLKYLMIGGDVLSARHINKVRKDNPNLIVINGYGPTENSCMSTYYRIERNFDNNIPIGKPVSNSTAYVFDRDLNFQPIGVIGELYVGGDGLAKGYINREDLNRNSFLDNPHIPGERLYRTGDYARWLPDGNLEFHGRIDNQLKIRGYRVELEEIESVISEIEGVIETVVKPVTVEEGDYKLIAFLNVDKSFKKNSKEIINRIKTKLPSYMVPSAYKYMYGFPKTVNGKIDRKALVFDIKELAGKECEDLKILTPTQRIIHNVWCEALKTSNISVTDNFFDIGGNSLLAIRLINIYKEKIGTELTFKEFATYPTIDQSANYIDNQNKGNSSEIKLIHLTDSTNLPLTSNQKRLWLISKFQPDTPSYIIGFSYKFSGSLNLEIFQKSLDLLFLRHHIVFSQIKEINGEPFCEIVPSKADYSFIDYSGQSGNENEKEKKVTDIIIGDSRKVIDLKNGPLYRIYLIKTASDVYYFHLNIHHIVFDGWSWSVMVNDLNEIYNGLLRGTEIDLEKLEFQQYDYAHWEQGSVHSDTENESKEFWKENLKGASPILNFPYDFQLREQASGRGGYEEISLSPVQSEKLRCISKIEGTSLFAAMLAVFGIQMHKYSGDNDISIGVPLAYRPHSKLENIFGMFVNTVVVRLRYTNELTFRNIIRETSEAALNAIAHQDLTFEKVVEIANPERSFNTNPLFQVAFAWQNNLDMPIKLDGINSKKITVKERTTPFDILLSLYENEGIIEGEIGYSTDLLKHESIIRLKNNFLHLINTLVENPDTTIDSLTMISEEENLMINTVNDTLADYSKEKTIVSLFEERAILDPEKTAVEFENSVLTYSDLNFKADHLAGVLRTHNIGNGDFVGVLLRRSPELIICLLAIFKSGAAYVPLNITDPENRVLSIISAANIKFVITNNDHDIDLTGSSERLTIEDLINQPGDFRDTDNNSVIKSTDPAYIIFTSGTTGTPKGVLVNHRSVINLIEWVNKTFEISGKDKLLWTTNLSFDLSVYDIFGILAAGAILRIISEEDRLDPKKQYDLLLNGGITFWDSAPQSLLQLIPHFRRNGTSGLYDSLRLVFLSGDWIPLSLPAAVTSVFPSAVVVGLGGATEATIWSNYFIIDNINPEWKSIPYGKPIQNSRYYILDDKMNYCRIQQPGSLFIGGDCLAREYYNDPVLTNSKFIPDPYNAGSKLYLTGDKAQWMTDGNIEFLGREDEQIKVRGYRVELGEIKNVVLKNKAIKEAVLLPDKSDRHNIKVILFFTTFNGIKLEARELKKELRESLPEYMIPAGIMHYTEFPCTNNGKINTKALLSDYLKSLNEDQNGNLTDGSATDLINLTPTQKVILKIWGETLIKANIPITENFFDVGGNSLSAFRIINNINEAIGFGLSFREFINHPTIIQSGNYIDSKLTGNFKSIELIHLNETANLPLSRNQKRLWLISKLQPDIPSYIIGFTYKLSGSLNREIFQKSLDILFLRHHIVFSVIKEINGEPYCNIVPSKAEISFIDYSGLSENEKDKNTREIIAADLLKVFDLKNGPLYRMYLIMTAKDEYYFHFSIHHIVFDGWSWSVLAKDLNEIYNRLLSDEEPVLEKLDFQQYDYAYWEENSVNLNSNSESKEFWKENLTGASPKLNFPYDFQRKDRPSGKGSYEVIHLSKEISEKLRTISKTEGSSLYTTLMSVFGIQMHRYSGDDDLNIGLPVAYRPHSKLENILGMFVNTVVIRLRYSKELTFRDIIRQTSDTTLNAIAHQDLPFDNIVEIVNPDRSSNANPLFQIAFIWQNNLDTPIKLNGIRSEKVPAKEGTNPFDILLSLSENGEIIEGEIGYSPDLLKQETILRWRKNFLNLINNLVENPDTAICTLSIISDEEKKIIDGFNDTVTDYPKGKTIVELFEDQANLYPDKTAIVYKDNAFTYSQLNKKTNQLARTLRESGVRDNVPVGILAEKSLEMMIGILAILKAGGGYVPIDPDYPEQRIKFILSDSGCKILLTQNKFMNGNFEGVTGIDMGSPSSYNPENSNIEKINNPSDLAYIMYTSGTTGIPKGSMILQRSVVRLVRNTNYIELSSEERILLTGAIVFDATTFEIWGALLNGGTLYIIDKETILDLKALDAELKKNEITVLWLTSALFTQIAENRTDIFAQLKYLLVGGDVLSAPHINKVRKDNPKLKIINGYGPTENTTFSTAFLIDRDFEYNIPIGKPVSNSTAYIFNKELNYQPVGVFGELYVGGDGVSKGYINREDLNNKSFIDNPYNQGERLYRTGDYARWLEDGNLEFHGRIDNQLKIRGFRVEIEEIESVISEIDGIIETVIKPVKIQEGDIRLSAFLNVSDTFHMDTKEIIRKIKEKLPSYMVPSAFKIMNGFPKTINGKTDRNALASDIDELVTRESKDLKSFTHTETIIYNIWSELLNTKDIAITDNFFEVGGNSLMAISVYSQIESVFNIELGLRVFFDSPKIKDLAEAIDIARHPLAANKSDEKFGKTVWTIVNGEI